MASTIRALHMHPSLIKINSHTNSFSFNRFLPLKQVRRRDHVPARRFFCRATGAPPIERSEQKEKKPSEKKGKIRIQVLLNHQVEFGEHIGIIGSGEELGLWEKQVELDWGPHGWICDLELPGGALIEYKFVIFRKGNKDKKWEDGPNRVLDLPGEGSFNMVCHWNETGESLDLVPFGTKPVGGEAVKMEGEDGNADEAVVEIVFLRRKENLDQGSEQTFAPKFVPSPLSLCLTNSRPLGNVPSGSLFLCLKLMKL
ncbi:phosphoglucan, water dikinase, chloroplastic-like [Carex rostrata]